MDTNKLAELQAEYDALTEQGEQIRARRIELSGLIGALQNERQAEEAEAARIAANAPVGETQTRVADVAGASAGGDA